MVEKKQTPIEIKPCPFCGGKGELIMETSPHVSRPRYFVACSVCGCEMPRISRKTMKAIEVWNRRSNV